MRNTIVATVLGLALLAGCGRNQSQQNAANWSLDHSAAETQLRHFVADKKAQAMAAVKATGQDAVPEYQALFAAAEKGDWTTVNREFQELSNRAPQFEHHGANDPRLTGTAWAAVLETYGAYECFTGQGDKYSIAFGKGIADSVPAGSIYFGGTDPGRFLVTALCKSQINGDPFFTITQNALADGGYLGYLRNMYGDKIYAPTDDDSKKCFSDYIGDAARRKQTGKLKTGEDVHIAPDGQVQVSGQVAVMEINGLLAKIIFDKNPDHEFYVEESYPLDWMYPLLEPHGLIMKINREPVSVMSDDIVNADHEFWTKFVGSALGNWLKDDTTVEQIGEFSQKVFLKHDLNGFTGDQEFVTIKDPQKAFSKLRNSIAGLYAWRYKHANDATERERMGREADFAFRQAWAMCPYSPEAAYRYIDLLTSENRNSDALIVGHTAEKLDPGNFQIRQTVRQLERGQPVQ